MASLFSQELKEGEEVIEIIRKHWGSFIVSAIKIALVFFVPFFLIPFLFTSNIGIIIFLILFVAALIYAIHLWVSWYFDIFIFTNQRVININQKSIISKEVSETTYENIQGATYQVSGILAMVFKYGSVKIQATGIKNLLEIESVKDPKGLQERILELRDKMTGSKDMSAEELIRLVKKINESRDPEAKEKIRELVSEEEDESDNFKIKNIKY